MTFKILLRKIVPKVLIDLKSIIKENLYWKKRGRIIRKKIIESYSEKSSVDISDEEIEVITYLKRNPISLLPYTFPKKYKESNIKVFYDTDNGFKYTLYEGKRLYFKKKWDVKKIKKYYNYLLVEQDVESPHRYLLGNFDIRMNDNIVDAGAAEGIFTLMNIDKIGHAVLFEPDLEWIEALKLTFKNYPEKVVIVEKYLGSVISNNETTIDNYFQQSTKIDFIKVDVEGFELDVLKGAKNRIRNADNFLRIAICTYHKQGDELILKDYLEQLNFLCEYSYGYIPFFYDMKMEEPYLRRALIRAKTNLAYKID